MNGIGDGCADAGYEVFIFRSQLWLRSAGRNFLSAFDIRRFDRSSICHGGVEFFGLAPVYVNNFVLLGMTGFFTAIVRAPLTGIILLFEMSGSISQMLSLSIVSGNGIYCGNADALRADL